MNKKQYNNVIDWTIKHEEAAKSQDSLEAARAIFKNMGVALPNGSMQEVFETIKTNDYMGWKACTMEEAQQAADKGVAAIGISEDTIVVLTAADEDEPVAQTASVMTLHENRSADAASAMQYYTYSYSTTTDDCGVADTVLFFAHDSLSVSVGWSGYNQLYGSGASTACWTSSNTNLASVDYHTGLIQAKQVGTAMITATTADGCYTASCVITVVAPELINNFIVNGTVTASDVKCTDDGFYIMTVSLADLFARNNIHYLSKSAEGPETRPVSRFYDDWYLFAIQDGTTVKYGGYKMREQENDDVPGDPNVDNDDPGVTISFMELSAEVFKACFNAPTQVNTYNLLRNLDAVTGPGKANYDPDIVKYFVKTESKGAYLIAEEYVHFIAQQSVNGIIATPNEYIAILQEVERLEGILECPGVDPQTFYHLCENRNKLLRVPNALEENNQKAGYNIYNPDNHTIQINNKNNLSMYEKYAILAMFTANVTFNSFAAEVVFHADAVDSWVADVDISIIGDRWYEAAIRADMAIGEDNESGFTDSYFDLNSDLVRAQAAIHGEY